MAVNKFQLIWEEAAGTQDAQEQSDRMDSQGERRRAVTQEGEEHYLLR